MPTAAGGIYIDPNGSSAVVQVTTPTGVAIPMFSDVNCTNSVVMPATITVRTAFYSQNPEPAASVSVKVGGTEYASPGNKVFQTSFQFGAMDGITLPDPSVLISAPAGTYAPAAWDTGLVPAPLTGLDLGSVGTWTTQIQSAALLNGYTQNGGAQNDRIDVGYVALAPGTWTLSVVVVKAVSAGIATIQLDDGAGNFTTLGTVDAYNATNLFNATASIAGIVIGSAVPNRKLRLLVASKNASSTGYIFPFIGYRFVRTA